MSKNGLRRVHDDTVFRDFAMWQASMMGLRPRLSRKAAWRKSQSLAVAAFCLVTASLAMSLGLRPAFAADTIRIAAQKTGTFDWELQIIKDHGLAKKAGLNLEVTELASTDAGKIAMMGGSADIILSDWLWVSRERSLGADLTFYPYSNTLGAVMVPDQSPIKSLTDLKGKKIGVAGGPLDKSWLLLQALAQKSNLDLESQATILYGAPPLLFQKALQGESDATLNFWNFCANLEAHGFRRLIGMDEVEKALGASAPVAMVGYVFHDSFAVKHRDVLRRFFAVTRQAMHILATSRADWQKLESRIGVHDAATLDIYRKRFIEGIPQRPIAADEADAAKLYSVLAHLGGAKLVGTGTKLAPGTYYKADGEK
jgi:NitT/TauT family transport system substrate-binding protein